MKKIGLALGGGGAKGFAHIPILEVFDELGIKPCCITGTSIGAVLGALYASGHSAKDIVTLIEGLVKPRNASLGKIVRGKDPFKVLSMIDPHFSFKPQGLIKGEKFLGFLYEQMQVSTFEELKIPFKTVATDFWRRKQIVFDSGDLLPRCWWMADWLIMSRTTCSVRTAIFESPLISWGSSQRLKQNPRLRWMPYSTRTRSCRTP
jgi:NTE family protein